MRERTRLVRGKARLLPAGRNSVVVDGERADGRANRQADGLRGKAGGRERDGNEGETERER